MVTLYHQISYLISKILPVELIEIHKNIKIQEMLIDNQEL